MTSIDPETFAPVWAAALRLWVGGGGDRDEKLVLAWLSSRYGHLAPTDLGTGVFWVISLAAQETVNGQRRAR